MGLLPRILRGRVQDARAQRRASDLDAALQRGAALILYDLLEKTGFRTLARKLYRVELEGTEHIPSTGGVILVANHESLFDPWLLALATPRPVRYMAKSELWGNRVVGRALEAFGAFPVERGAGDATAISRAAELLRSGEVLGIFPQGTSKQLERRPFHRGAARLALATGAPIVPIRLLGTRGVPRPGRPPARVLVGRQIAVKPAKPTLVAAKELTQRVGRELVEAG